jgi:hypothetical protein
MTKTRVSRAGNIVLAGILIAVGVYAWSGHAGAASSLPADKMTVTASKTSVAAPNTTATLMTARMKTSTPADLLLQVAAECTILSSITNTGSETQAYTAKIDVWVEVDGKPVPVVPGPTSSGATSGSGGADDGRVVFCNREFQRTTVFDAQNESIKDIDNTTQANGFNWVALNVGNGIHTIEVKAHFTDTNGADTFAHGVVGGRTLIAEPTNYFISQPSA